MAIFELHCDGIVAGAIQNSLLGFLRQFIERGVHASFVMANDSTQGLGIILRRRPRPRGDGAAIQAQGRVGDDQLRVNKLPHTQTITGGACTERIVEGKQPGLYFLDGESRNRASKFCRKRCARTAVRVLGKDDAVAHLQCRLEAVGQPGAQIGFYGHPIHDDLDVVFDLFVQGRNVFDCIDLAVHFHPQEPALQQSRQFFAVFAFASADDGGQ